MNVGDGTEGIGFLTLDNNVIGRFCAVVETNDADGFDEREGHKLPLDSKVQAKLDDYKSKIAELQRRMELQEHIEKQMHNEKKEEDDKENKEEDKEEEEEDSSPDPLAALRDNTQPLHKLLTKPPAAEPLAADPEIPREPETKVVPIQGLPHRAKSDLSMEIRTFPLRHVTHLECRRCGLTSLKGA